MSSSGHDLGARSASHTALLPALADATLGLTAGVVNAAGRTIYVFAPIARPAVRLALRPPLVPQRYRAPMATATLRSRGRRVRTDLASLGGTVLDRLVPRVMDEVLRRVDVTEVVVTRVDLDAVAARLDVTALLDRVDLAAVATQVIDAVDLPELIRESSGAMASDTVLGARLRGIAGDQAIGRVRDRLLPRRDRLSAAVASAQESDAHDALLTPERP